MYYFIDDISLLHYTAIVIINFTDTVDQFCKYKKNTSHISADVLM